MRNRLLLGHKAADLQCAESDTALAACMNAWNMSSDNFVFVKERLRRLQQEWPDDGTVRPRRGQLTALQHTALQFLHFKDLGRDLDDSTRPFAFKSLVCGDRASKAHKRLMSLVALPEDVTWDGKGLAPWAFQGLQTWADFIQGSAGKAWRHASLCFTDATVLQRVQPVSPSFMLAPSVLMHYLKLPTPDVSKHKLRRMSAAELWDFVTEDRGGFAEDYLRQVCGSPSLALHHVPYSTMTSAKVVHGLETWGPALISSCEVLASGTAEDPLYQSQNGVLLGACDLYGTGSPVPRTSPRQLHSMLIVGHRTLRNGAVRFLVQNWWLKRQFFECDSSFLIGRRAHLAWVTDHPRTGAPSAPSAPFVYSEPCGPATTGPFVR